MSPFIIEASLVALAALYVAYWRINATRKRKQSWDEMVGKLRANDWGLDEVSEKYLYREGITATPSNIWQKIDGARGLWAMYQNAPVLIQLADYAAEHGENVSLELTESLRSDAFQIRVCVIMSLCKYAFAKTSVGASVDACRATTLYTGMLARMTQLFQEHSALLFPRYLDAM
jgi:hypothetical protein